MDSIPGQFPISLQAWPSKDNKSAALPSLISRINAQRGSFRSVTEEGLEEELKKGKEEVVAVQEDDNNEGEDGKEEQSDRLKEVMTGREDILGQLEQAHNAAMFALDFISLLLSKDTPVQASLSISPALREAVASGTLGADRLHDSRITKPQKQEIERIASGWKLESLTETVDSVLASATRLEKEVKKETKYWQQILAVDDQGWAICRLPQEKHTLGVRFGFLESAPAFSNRSLAALRRNSDGTVYLDQGVVDASPKRIRVRIKHNGHFTGTSLLQESSPQSKSIESLILTARNTIYEEELWQELHRESRVLASLGVRVVGGDIYCPMTSTKDIVLDLVSTKTDNWDSRNDIDDAAAEMISLSLHLLLSHAHRQNLRRRSQDPPPITGRIPLNLPYNLLRPILARIHHEAVILAFTDLCRPLAKALKSTGVSDASYFWQPTPLKTLGDTVRQSPDKLLDALISDLSAEINVPLTKHPQSQSVNIRLKTILYPSIDTRYHITTVGQFSDSCKPPPNPLSSKEVKDYILWATACALAGMFIQQRSQDGDPAIDVNEGDEASAWNLHGWQSTHNSTILRMPCKNEADSKELRIKVDMVGSPKDVVEIRADFKHVWGAKKSSYSVTQYWKGDGAKEDFPEMDEGALDIITLEIFVKEAEKRLGDSTPAEVARFEDEHDVENGLSSS